MKALGLSRQEGVEVKDVEPGSSEPQPHENLFQEAQAACAAWLGADGKLPFT